MKEYLFVGQVYVHFVVYNYFLQKILMRSFPNLTVHEVNRRLWKDGTVQFTLLICAMRLLHGSVFVGGLYYIK